jgi:hypothetical protein
MLLACRTAAIGLLLIRRRSGGRDADGVDRVRAGPVLLTTRHPPTGVRLPSEAGTQTASDDHQRRDGGEQAACN